MTANGVVPQEKRRYRVYSYASNGNPLYIGSFDDPADANKLIRRMLEAMRPLNLSAAQYRLELVDAQALAAG